MINGHHFKTMPSKSTIALFIGMFVTGSTWAALEVDLIYTGNFVDSHSGLIQFTGSSDPGTPTQVDTARATWKEPTTLFINDSGVSFSANTSTVLTSTNSSFEPISGIIFRYDSTRVILEMEVNLQTDAETTLTGLNTALAPDFNEAFFWESIASRVGTSTTLQPDFFGSGFGDVAVNFVPEPGTWVTMAGLGALTIALIRKKTSTNVY